MGGARKLHLPKDSEVVLKTVLSAAAHAHDKYNS